MGTPHPQYFGMHLINDLQMCKYFESPPGCINNLVGAKYNVRFLSDHCYVALKNIKQGEELFVEYRYKKSSVVLTSCVRPKL